MISEAGDRRNDAENSALLSQEYILKYITIENASTYVINLLVFQNVLVCIFLFLFVYLYSFNFFFSVDFRLLSYFYYFTLTLIKMH